MMMNNTNDCQHIEVLISGYLDGELTQQESQKVALHLTQCEECLATYQGLKDLQQAIGKISCQEIEHDKLDAIVNDLTSRRIEGLAWFSIIAGLVVLIVFSLSSFWFDAGVAWYIKLAISFLWGGGIGLFVSVLRQRWISKKSDKYKKVKL